MKEGKHSVINIIFGSFFAFGLVFLVIGILLHGVLGKIDKEDCDPVIAVIDDIDRWDDEHRVYINYTYNGQEYNHVRYNLYTSGMHEGKEIEVLVNRYDPTSFYIGNMGLIFLLAFGGTGLIFMIIGGIGVGVGIRNDLEAKRIKSTGLQRWGIIRDLTINRNVAVNNRHPYRVVVNYEDDSIVTTTTEYISKDVWVVGDPLRFVGQQVKVYVDPQNEKKYVVDISSIPQI